MMCAGRNFDDWYYENKGVEVVVVGGEGEGIAPTERGRGLNYSIFSILSSTKFTRGGNIIYQSGLENMNRESRDQQSRILGSRKNTRNYIMTCSNDVYVRR